MEKELKYFLALVFTLFLSPTFGQYSFGGGLSSFHGVNLDITRMGAHAYFEQPRSEINTFFLRGTLMLPQKYTTTGSVEANTTSVSPQKLDGIRVEDKTSFFSVDGGTRIYFLNTYDAGFSLYGGGHLKGIISSYSRTYDLDSFKEINSDIDPNNYNTQNIEPLYSLLFSFGGNFGAKYQLPYRGALTFDLALDLISRIVDPAEILGNEISPLSLSFNLAYRFDWY